MTFPGVYPKKPELIAQETASLACALRILLKMSCDENRASDWPSVQNMLLQVFVELYFICS